MINLLLISGDIKSGAINNDVWYLQKILKNKCNVYIIHEGDLQDYKNQILSVKALNIFEKFFFIRTFCKKNKINIIHIKGLISLWHLYYFTIIRILKINYIISPFSQLNKYNLKYKLFYENPDVNKLTKLKYNFKHYILSKFGPLFKRMLLNIFIRYFILKSETLICFSRYEQKNALKYKDNTDIIQEPSFIKILKKKKNKVQNNIYNNKNINIIYWGRIDFYLKGIDRIIKLAEKIKLFDSTNKILFYLAGPDYNGGLKEANLEIKKRKLDNKVFILKKKYWKNIKYLTNADYSILLSRWDGYPRSLRESLYYKIPIIVSEETNFNDIVKKNKCGYVLNKISNNKVKLLYLSLMKREKFTLSCYSAALEINPVLIGNKLLKIYNKYKVKYS